MKSNTRNILYIGVTGLPGSGKGEFIRILEGKITELNIAFRYYSLSDELRDETRKRGLPVERPMLRKIANELREGNGNGFLATLLLRKIHQETKKSDYSSGEIIVIDAIRNPEEITTLAKNLRESFLMAAIEAPIELLVERLASRARTDENADVVNKAEVARQMILSESGENEPAHGHNISKCIEMSDFIVRNETTFDELERQVNQFIDTKIARLLSSNDLLSQRVTQ